MTIGQVAGLIAAIAFLILVVWVGWFLTKTSKNLHDTVDSLSKLADDADRLSREVDDILHNTNELLDDLNEKSAAIDPAVKAIGDLGQSVSDVNDASRNFVDKITSSAHRKSNRLASNVGKLMLMGLASRWGKKSKKEAD